MPHHPLLQERSTGSPQLLSFPQVFRSSEPRQRLAACCSLASTHISFVDNRLSLNLVCSWRCPETRDSPAFASQCWDCSCVPSYSAFCCRFFFKNFFSVELEKWTHCCVLLVCNLQMTEKGLWVSKGIRGSLNCQAHKMKPVSDVLSQLTRTSVRFPVAFLHVYNSSDSHGTLVIREAGKQRSRTLETRIFRQWVGVPRSSWGIAVIVLASTRARLT